MLLESSPTSKVLDGLRERDGSVDKLLLNVKDSVSRSSQFDAATHDARVPLSKLTNSANSAIHSLTVTTLTTVTTVTTVSYSICEH